MSWHFSLELEEEFLEGNSLDGEQNALWKSIPFAPDDSCSDKMKDICHRSPFGMMFVHSTDDNGTELLTWFLEDSRAKIFQQQEKVKESQEVEVDCGKKWQGLLAKYNQNSHIWKTAQCSLLGDSEEFLETWPRWGLMLDGECWDLDISGMTTCEKESGLLPTPSGTSNHGKNHVSGRLDEWGGSSNKFRRTEIGKVHCPNFEEWIMAWPVLWSAQIPLETDRFLMWQQQHSKFLAELENG